MALIKLWSKESLRNLYKGIKQQTSVYGWEDSFSTNFEISDFFHIGQDEGDYAVSQLNYYRDLHFTLKQLINDYIQAIIAIEPSHRFSNIYNYITLLESEANFYVRDYSFIEALHSLNTFS